MPCQARAVTNGQVADTGNATTYASGTFTPLPGKLYLLGVVHADAAPEATVPTIATTTGLAFVQVGSSIAFDTIASNIHRLTVFRAMKFSGLAAGTYTITLGDAGTGACGLLIELNEVIQTGSDGANAIIQSPTNVANASANPNVTLAAFGSANNATVLFVASDIQTAPTAEAGGVWTELGTNPDFNTPATGLACFWRPSNDTSATSVLASSDWAAMAIEVGYAHNTEACKGWLPTYPSILRTRNEVVSYGPQLPGVTS
jgi:hypothetical protein